MKEEQIDELSKDTLARYAIKAHRRGDMARQMSDGGKNKDMDKYANKRYKGVQTAIKKMWDMKEEQIDELHGKGKLSDIAKASHKKMDAHHLGHGHPENPHTHDVHRNNELQRMKKDDEWYKASGGRNFKRGIKGFAQSQLHRGAKKEFLAKHGPNEE